MTGERVKSANAAQGAELSLLGAIRSADLTFVDGSTFSFEVTARLCACIKLSDADNRFIEEDTEPGNLQVEACVTGRAAMKVAGDPRGSLPLDEFMDLVVPPADLRLVPSFDQMTTEQGSQLLDPKAQPSEEPQP